LERSANIRGRTGRYEVFDGNGRWGGNVDLTPDVGFVESVSMGRIATTWHDDLGIAYVRVYPLLESE